MSHEPLPVLSKRQGNFTLAIYASDRVSNTDVVLKTPHMRSSAMESEIKLMMSACEQKERGSMEKTVFPYYCASGSSPCYSNEEQVAAPAERGPHTSRCHCASCALASALDTATRWATSQAEHPQLAQRSTQRRQKARVKRAI